MNRHERRSLRSRIRGAVAGLAHPVPDSVALQGGPMAGWIVKPGAACLAPDWYRTWIPSIEARWAPGSYVLTAGGRRARWRRLQGGSDVPG